MSWGYNRKEVLVVIAIDVLALAIASAELLIFRSLNSPRTGKEDENRTYNKDLLIVAKIEH